MPHLRPRKGGLSSKTAKFEVLKQVSQGEAPLKRLPTRMCACPCEGVIDLIGKKWSLCIITALGNSGRLRFNALQGALPGISPRTLADTLK